MALGNSFTTVPYSQMTNEHLEKGSHLLKFSVLPMGELLGTEDAKGKGNVSGRRGWACAPHTSGTAWSTAGLCLCWDSAEACEVEDWGSSHPLVIVTSLTWCLLMQEECLQAPGLYHKQVWKGGSGAIWLFINQFHSGTAVNKIDQKPGPWGACILTIGDRV